MDSISQRDANQTALQKTQFSDLALYENGKDLPLDVGEGVNAWHFADDAVPPREQFHDALSVVQIKVLAKINSWILYMSYSQSLIWAEDVIQHFLPKAAATSHCLKITPQTASNE